MPSQTITPQNLNKYFYRSFSFEFKKGKTLVVITDTDSDFEAWIVALKRLLGSKSEWGVCCGCWVTCPIRVHVCKNHCESLKTWVPPMGPHAG